MYFNRRCDVVEQEIWRDVVGYEGIYKVSNFGRVITLSRQIWNGKGWYTSKERLIKPSVNYKGYEMVYLSKNGSDKMFFVHRLVATAFIANNNIQKNTQVNHKDGNKRNNRTENLEWCDNSYNQIHAYKMGLNHISPNSGKPNIPVAQIDPKTNSVINTYASVSEASRATGIVARSILNCVHGYLKNGISHGYVWRKI